MKTMVAIDYNGSEVELKKPIRQWNSPFVEIRNFMNDLMFENEVVFICESMGPEAFAVLNLMSFCWPNHKFEIFGPQNEESQFKNIRFQEIPRSKNGGVQWSEMIRSPLTNVIIIDEFPSFKITDEKIELAFDETLHSRMEHLVAGLQEFDGILVPSLLLATPEIVLSILSLPQFSSWKSSLEPMSPEPLRVREQIFISRAFDTEGMLQKQSTFRSLSQYAMRGFLMAATVSSLETAVASDRKIKTIAIDTEYEEKILSESTTDSFVPLFLVTEKSAKLHATA